MKSESFPLVITEKGTSASIRKTFQTKNGKEYTAYVIDYFVLGKRKREWRSSLEEAKVVAKDACRRASSGENLVLELRNSDRLAYIRATEGLSGLGIPIDVGALRYAELCRMIAPEQIPDAINFFLKHHSGVVRKSVPDAANELIAQIEAEQSNTTNSNRRKDAWVKLLKAHLVGKLARDFQCEVSELSGSLLEPWLIGLRGSERTRRNVRDCVAYFLKWSKGRNYLAKDSDPLLNVMNFRKRKRGAIKVLSPDDLAKLLAGAQGDFVPYLALRAFAGLRDCEARAMDWQLIDLRSGWVDIPDHIAKQADDDEGVARMVRIRPVLAEWLRPYAQKSGAVCRYVNSVKQLGKLANRVNVVIPRNALRHSFISAAVTLSSDLNAVSVEAGNSPTVIRQHYWRKMRPEQAEAWFRVARAAGPHDSGAAQILPSRHEHISTDSILAAA